MCHPLVVSILLRTTAFQSFNAQVIFHCVYVLCFLHPFIFFLSAYFGWLCILTIVKTVYLWETLWYDYLFDAMILCLLAVYIEVRLLSLFPVFFFFKSTPYCFPLVVVWFVKSVLSKLYQRFPFCLFANSYSDSSAGIFCFDFFLVVIHTGHFQILAGHL